MDLKTQIQNIIDDEIKSQLLLHGGGIQLKAVEGKKITVTLTGSCHNCPQAQITTEEIVEETLRRRLGDEEISVHLYQEIDESLWEFAKQILRKNHE
ncbi:NifU family protein [Guggenheimella bovis]